MNYEPRIELGHIVQSLGTLAGVIIACVFAYAFLVSDVDNAKGQIKENKETIAKEAIERKEAVAQVRTEFKAEVKEIKQEIKTGFQGVEGRQRFLLEDIRDEVRYVRERVDEERTSSK